MMSTEDVGVSALNFPESFGEQMNLVLDGEVVNSDDSTDHFGGNFMLINLREKPPSTPYYIYVLNKIYHLLFLVQLLYPPH